MRVRVLHTCCTATRNGQYYVVVQTYGTHEVPGGDETYLFPVRSAARSPAAALPPCAHDTYDAGGTGPESQSRVAALLRRAAGAAAKSRKLPGPRVARRRRSSRSMVSGVWRDAQSFRCQKKCTARLRATKAAAALLAARWSQLSRITRGASPPKRPSAPRRDAPATRGGAPPSAGGPAPTDTRAER